MCLQFSAPGRSRGLDAILWEQRVSQGVTRCLPSLCRDDLIWACSKVTALLSSYLWKQSGWSCLRCRSCGLQAGPCWAECLQLVCARKGLDFLFLWLKLCKGEKYGSPGTWARMNGSFSSSFLYEWWRMFLLSALFFVTPLWSALTTTSFCTNVYFWWH